MNADIQRDLWLHSPEDAPAKQSFAYEWVLPVVGGVGCALILIALCYLIAAWWVA